MKEQQAFGQNGKRGRALGVALGAALTLAGVGLCAVPGVPPDLSDFFDLSMGLTVLLLGALTLFLAREGFFRLWAFAAGGTEGPPGVRVISALSARRALILCFCLFSALTLLPALCCGGAVRAAAYLLFCLHTGCFVPELFRAARLKGIPPRTPVILNSAGVKLPDGGGSR